MISGVIRLQVSRKLLRKIKNNHIEKVNPGQEQFVTYQMMRSPEQLRSGVFLKSLNSMTGNKQ